MGSAFELLIHRSQTGFFRDRYEKFSGATRGSAIGFSVNASLGPNRCLTSLKRLEAEAKRNCGSNHLQDQITASVLPFTTRPSNRKNRSDRNCWKPQWRCCDSGATEASSSSTVSYEIVGSDAQTDIPTSSSTLNTSSDLSVQLNYDNRFTEAGLEVVISLEEAENEVLKAVGGKDVERFSARSPDQKAVSVPVEFQHRNGGASQSSRSSELERGFREEKNDSLQGIIPEERSAVASAAVVSEVGEGLKPTRLADVLQSVVKVSTIVDENQLSESQFAGKTLDFRLDPLIVQTTDDGAQQFVDGEEDHDKGLLEQMRDIIMFAGPTLGIWLSGPIMSLIDTAVVGNSSSLELAALGPGTVFCDQTCYVFMFLSVATSNLIATSLARKDETEAAHHLSRLLFVALACGVGMFLLTGAFATPLLQAFVGSQNAGLVPAARSYVQIRGLAWPAVLVGMVAQSASLGMQDAWGPLKVLAVASFVNLSGDILLCNFLGYGIAGAAWATMLSQYIAGFLMLRSLNKKGYNALAVSIPSSKELVNMIEIAAPVLLTMLSKVLFYTVITYLSASLGAVTLAAHQVMIGIYSTCTVSGEPLAQTAQSFMPALMQGANQNLKKAQMLLRSLLIIGAVAGLSLGCFGICFPWVFPQVFTSDKAVISQMRAVTLPFFCSLVVTPPVLSLEGTLLAGRDLQFLSFSMVSCFAGGTFLLLMFNRLGFGLQGFWWTLVCFQSTRFIMAFARLRSAKSVLKYSQSVAEESASRLKAA